jgi:hypothetical protein
MDFGDGNKAPGKKRRAEDDAPPAVSEIDGNTVCKAATHLITRETKECVVAWFTAVDTDCSGCLEEKDIHGYQLPSGVLLWDTIKSADLDGDGKISLLEFETTLIKFVLTSRCLSEASWRPPLPLPLCFRALLVLRLPLAHAATVFSARSSSLLACDLDHASDLAEKTHLDVRRMPPPACASVDRELCEPTAILPPLASLAAHERCCHLSAADTLRRVARFCHKGPLTLLPPLQILIEISIWERNLSFILSCSAGRVWHSVFIADSGNYPRKKNHINTKLEKNKPLTRGSEWHRARAI